MTKYDGNLNALFLALSDPTRRGMIQQLTAGPASVSELAKPTNMALPTVLKHLEKLEDGGLILTEKRGRTRVCRANPKGIKVASDWLDRMRADWTARLDRLEDYLDTLPEDTETNE
ncbi:MAG: metalloregulator ArsR/SmtB family transcription factor [Pseudomonadota bacterium]